jgi:hypothetical protein
MKLLKFALIVPILIGCNSKNNSIEVLHQNAQSYTQAANTTAYRGDDAIVYFNIADNRLNINLIDKGESEELSELSIVECKVNKLTYTPVEFEEANSKEAGKHYYIDLTKDDK